MYQVAKLGASALASVLLINGGGGDLVTKSCPTLVTPWTVALQAPLSMGFSRQQYQTGLSFPSLGDLPHPGIKPGSPALEVTSSPSEPPGKSSLKGDNEAGMVHFVGKKSKRENSSVYRR